MEEIVIYVRSSHQNTMPLRFLSMLEWGPLSMRDLWPLHMLEAYPTDRIQGNRRTKCGEKEYYRTSDIITASQIKIGAKHC